MITAEIFPNGDFCKEMSAEEVEKLFENKVMEINNSMISAKNIRRLRIREKEFEKTTSKKIIRNQAEKGRIIK